MKRKVFQYGLMYWLAVLINIIISYYHIAYSYSILISPYIDSKDIFFLTFIVLVGIFSVVSLYFLLTKHRLAILTYSILLVLININILVCIFEAAVYNEKTKNGTPHSDYLLSLGIYLFIFGLWFIIIRRYRYKRGIADPEIENIGKHED